jgi:two-component system chemotaxis response regulator CheY
MLKVVIADASAISRDLLGTILTNGGHHVVGTTNTSSAGLARAIKMQPQIMCIDIGHADDEGIALLDTIRNELPKTVVFMVSGAIDSTAVQSALQHGVHGFIVKPFNTVTVLKTIRNTVLNLVKQQQVKVEE